MAEKGNSLYYVVWILDTQDILWWDLGGMRGAINKHVKQGGKVPNFILEIWGEKYSIKVNIYEQIQVSCCSSDRNICGFVTWRRKRGSLNCRLYCSAVYLSFSLLVFFGERFCPVFTFPIEQFIMIYPPWPPSFKLLVTWTSKQIEHSQNQVNPVSLYISLIWALLLLTWPILTNQYTVIPLIRFQCQLFQWFKILSL